MSRKRKGKGRKPLTAAQRRAYKEGVQTEAAKLDVHGKPDRTWGTTGFAIGEVKRSSDEAKLATCPECGYSAGRHSRLCSLGS